ncbi:MAG: YchJ family protein [Gammaproteobacteria bacterium]|nr:YchJ family protein [Gammaproteobacteria bacterium]
MVKDAPDCPCGSGRGFSECCGGLLSGEQVAVTAEQLMRSRYSAFVLMDEAYLRKTWHPDTCPDRIELDDDTRWLGLKIKSTQTGGESDDEGLVEFVARYKIASRGHRLHEVSRFIRRDGLWVYLDGTHS